ncbi:deoxyguanosinetriphosphate triphosphohydrolase [Ligaoa zhengdingensis]|uniref:deoxyguanosinetriphosphate triphosphohydrolase n=1 Tax=Ligaoa zhengdingensis TaxID=2763658 RepID=UPI0031BBC8D2
MEWASLLSTNKLGAEVEEPRDWASYPINAFEKDYNKIVSSAAFRRLQDKTQVFPLDKSDFIRTRLTHSIEVSTIARQLGIMISKNTTRYRQQAVADFAEDISSVLLCAGLLHDLGNPPFGHFGEAVIGEWFQNNLGKILYRSNEDTPADQRHTLRSMLTPQMVADLENFEGNAQSLRLLSKARHGSDINVSVSVISTLIKYPTNSLSFSRTAADVATHKVGYYLEEQDTFLQISDTIGTKRENGSICRHPLAFFLEAADDIAYATADLEDAFKKRLFTLPEFIEYFKSGYDHDQIGIRTGPNNYSKEHYSNELITTLESYTDIPEDERFHRWIHYTRRWLMHNATFRFSKEYENIMNGMFQDELFSNVNHTITMKILKAAMGEFVYNSSGILRLELSAQTILSFLLDKFVHAVLYFGREDGTYRLTQANKKCLHLISNNYKNDYNEEIRGHEDDEGYCLYLRLLMVTDYISGMTDSYARTLYRELSGIE